LTHFTSGALLRVPSEMPKIPARCESRECDDPSSLKFPQKNATKRRVCRAFYGRMAPFLEKAQPAHHLDLKNFFLAMS
jgi:hypothetical protein